MPANVEDALGHERVELDEALHVERHNSIEPVPEACRDAKPLHQFWIWGGANIAPINWVLGALGIVLGLGFWDTVLALALGNLLGVALFGSFVLMGQRTGVTQMVLSRSAFGRRGGYLRRCFKSSSRPAGSRSTPGSSSSSARHCWSGWGSPATR